MTEQLVYLLLGLFFIGTSLPSLLTPIGEGSKRPAGPVVQFVFGIILVALAFLAVHLIR